MQFDLGQGFTEALYVTIITRNDTVYWTQSANLTVYLSPTTAYLSPGKVLCGRSLSPATPGAPVSVWCGIGLSSVRYVTVEGPRRTADPQSLAMHEIIVARDGACRGQRRDEYRDPRAGIASTEENCVMNGFVT